MTAARMRVACVCRSRRGACTRSALACQAGRSLGPSPPMPCRVNTLIFGAVDSFAPSLAGPATRRPSLTSR
eukprot:scaffold2830_cov395-Prasinococcus_capsulatus_cf.AAC.4